MANYGTIESVKERLNVADDLVDWDNRIDRCLNDADHFINQEISIWDVTFTSFSGTPPVIISDAANDLAAGYVREETGGNPTATELSTQSDSIAPASRMNVFLMRGKEKLKNYIRLTYFTPALVKSGPSVP